MEHQTDGEMERWRDDLVGWRETFDGFMCGIAADNWSRKSMAALIKWATGQKCLLLLNNHNLSAALSWDLFLKAGSESKHFDECHF